MYIPTCFKENDLHNAAALVKENEFGILTAFVSEKIQAVHIPFLLKENGEKWILFGHFAVANPIAQAIENNAEVLVIFQGPHAYVSASWYQHLSVSTWNYSAVHCYGKIEKLNNEDTIDLLQQTMKHYESYQQKGLLWEDLPTTLIENLLNGLIAFKIEVTAIEAKNKLSQNKSTHDIQSIINHLKKGTALERQVAENMKKLYGI